MEFPYSVASVHPDHVEYSVKDPETGAVVKHSIPTNFVLWSTGIAMNPFTARVSINSSPSLSSLHFPLAYKATRQNELTDLIYWWGI